VKGRDWLTTSKLVILVGITHNSENELFIDIIESLVV